MDLIKTPLRYTSYPVTPTLSVDAVQENVTAVLVTVPWVKPVGTVGGSFSAMPHGLPEEMIPFSILTSPVPNA
ncbi:hypothetical protein D3C81_1140110 [compost metagenome]